MFKSIASLAVAAATTLVATAPAEAASNHAEHVTLANAIKAAGVSIYVNPEVCWERQSFGFYVSSIKALVVCQEGKSQPDVVGVWSEEDYDTLRHEAQHMIQDCMVGSIADDQLGSVYREPVNLAKRTFSMQEIRNIIAAYPNASEHVIVLELEAFSVAAMNDPIEQARDIQKYCF